MTAGNAVFRWVARWFMRFEAAGNILRIVLFGGTFLTTGLQALKSYGHGQYAIPFIAAVGGGTIAFAYAYTRFGVYNQKNRDTADMGDNYSGPTMLMDSQLEAVQLAYLGHALQNGEKDFDVLREDLQDLTTEQWHEFRGGLDEKELRQ